MKSLLNSPGLDASRHEEVDGNKMQSERQKMPSVGNEAPWTGLGRPSNGLQRPEKKREKEEAVEKNAVIGFSSKELGRGSVRVMEGQRRGG